MRVIQQRGHADAREYRAELLDARLASPQRARRRSRRKPARLCARLGPVQRQRRAFREGRDLARARRRPSPRAADAHACARDAAVHGRVAVGIAIGIAVGIAVGIAIGLARGPAEGLVGDVVERRVGGLGGGVGQGGRRGLGLGLSALGGGDAVPEGRRLLRKRRTRTVRQQRRALTKLQRLRSVGVGTRRRESFAASARSEGYKYPPRTDLYNTHNLGTKHLRGGVGEGLLQAVVLGLKTLKAALVALAVAGLGGCQATVHVPLVPVTNADCRERTRATRVNEITVCLYEVLLEIFAVGTRPRDRGSRTLRLSGASLFPTFASDC